MVCKTSFSVDVDTFVDNNIIESELMIDKYKPTNTRCNTVKIVDEYQSDLDDTTETIIFIMLNQSYLLLNLIIFVYN